jgi:hypothetical protein
MILNDMALILELLGKAKIPDASFEQPDGTPEPDRHRLLWRESLPGQPAARALPVDR